MSLQLKEINIKKGCMYLKSLQPGTYEFIENKPIDNFYGENIEITAIVGKNGSGKSSLLEILFRMVNNLSFFITYKECVNYDNAVFVFGLNADLYYSYDKIDCKILCREKSVAFCYGNESWRFGDEHPDFTNYKDGNEMREDEKKEMCKNLFFTLISNYSLQAYVDEDYSSDIVGVLKNGNLEEDNTKKPWIHYIFHKNDGYKSAININPFRDNGTIDMLNEEKLHKQRMESLLLYYAKKKKDFIDGYKLSKIEYKFDKEKFCNKIIGDRNKTIDKLVEDFKKILQREESVAKSILNEFIHRFNSNELGNNMFVYTCLYIVDKVINVPQTYSFYRTEGFKCDDGVLTVGDENVRTLAIMLSKSIKTDHSHISNKINQAVNFIKKIRKGFRLENDSFLWSDFDAIKINDDLNKSNVLENKIRCLPPSFFERKIYVKSNNDELRIEHMSAGERQLYYILSTLIYHILNIKSVTREERVRYNKILIVLDEVDLGFHPDLQRRFIDFLIMTFKNLELNKFVGLHFLITTHSPFMLSDIYENNIIYLENGVKKNKDIHTFAANISDMLAQSFFLGGGFVGEFSKKKILSLLEWCLGKGDKDSKEWYIDKAKQFVEVLGEPIIKKRMNNLLDLKIGYEENIP